MKKIIFCLLFTGTIFAQDSLIVDYIYKHFPETRPYIEVQKAETYALVTLDTTLSDYVRVWKAYNGLRLCEIHAGLDIIAIVPLGKKDGIVLDTFKDDEYLFLGEFSGDDIPNHYNKVIRKIEEK